MRVVLQPDAADRLQLNVHTTFDESDGQNPQPWRVWILELNEVHDVASGTEDLAVTLPAQGIYTLEVRCNNSSLREKYSTGEVGLPVSMPVEITAVDPSPVAIWTGFAAHDFVITGTGLDGSGEFGPNVVMAMLANAAGDEVSSGGGTHGDGVYNVSFTSLPPGVVAGDKVVVFTKDAMMEPSSNKFEVELVEAPPPPPTPVIDAIAPDTGPVAGGTAVTLTGSNLTGCTGVDFNNIAATAVVVVDDATVTCVTPAQANPSQVSVQADTPAGGSNFWFPWIYA